MSGILRSFFTGPEGIAGFFPQLKINGLPFSPFNSHRESVTLGLISTKSLKIDLYTTTGRFYFRVFLKHTTLAIMALQVGNG